MNRINSKILEIYKILRYQANKNEEFDSDLYKLNNKILELTDNIKKLSDLVNSNNTLSSEIDNRVDLISKKLNSIDLTKIKANQKTTVTMADNHLLDSFYVSFEDLFRGTENDIYNRLKVYLEHINKAVELNPDKPILDIGCGRGEFLRLAKENNIKAIGLDLNSAMVTRALENGFKVTEEHAQTYLNKQKSKSLAGVTGFHIAEHIPFDELLTIFSECYRVLDKGGIIIFETPNPENLQTAAWKFYYDPSHLHPLPPEMLKFAVESVGFKDAYIKRLHPVKNEYSDPPGDESTEEYDMKYRLYGPQDYAIIAYK